MRGIWRAVRLGRCPRCFLRGVGGGGTSASTRPFSKSTRSSPPSLVGTTQPRQPRKGTLPGNRSVIQPSLAADSSSAWIPRWQPKQRATMHQTESLPPSLCGWRWWMDRSVNLSGFVGIFLVRFTPHFSHRLSARRMTNSLPVWRLFPTWNPFANLLLDHYRTEPLTLDAVGLLVVYDDHSATPADRTDLFHTDLVVLVRPRGVTPRKCPAQPSSPTISASITSSTRTGPPSNSCTCCPASRPKIRLIMPGLPSPPEDPRAFTVIENPSRSISA